jgi:hypothetical protein
MEGRERNAGEGMEGNRGTTEIKEEGDRLKYKINHSPSRFNEISTTCVPSKFSCR